MQKTSLSDRILKAGAAVLTAHICFKAVGFLQFFIVGGIIDTQAWETVYGFAFDGIIFSIFLIGEEMIGPALLPVFSKTKEQHGEKTAWTTANILLSWQLIILTIIILLLMLFPDKITTMLTYWKSNRNSDYYKLASSSVQAMAPALLCFSIASTTYILLNGYKKFFIAAFGDAVWKLFILICAAIGIGILGFNYKALILGIILGSLAKLGTHLIGLRHQLHFMRFNLNFRNPAFKSMLWLLLPLLVGILFAKVRDFYNHITILSSLDTQGLIKANAYGRKLFQVISTIVPYTLSIAMFPFLCDLANRNSHKEMGDLLTKSGKMLLSVFIPASFTFIILAPPLVQLLVMGKFSPHDAKLAGISMATYTLILPAYSLEMLLMQAFFAKRRMIAITVIGIIFSSFSMLFSYIGIVHFKQTGVNALVIVAAGFVISRTLKTTTLILLLKRSVPCFALKSTFPFLGKTISAGIICCLIAHLTCILFENLSITPWLQAIFPNKYLKLPLLLKLTCSTATTGITFILCAYFLKITELRDMLYWCRKKILNKTTNK